MIKRLTLLITVVALALSLAACTSKETGLDTDAEGEITVMLYNVTATHMKT